MSVYRSMRDWVDHMLAEGVRSRGVLLPAFPPLFLPAFTGSNAFVWVIAISLAVAWFAFVAWRGWRMMKATAIRSDRTYDHSEKFKLSNEYHSTESATSAAWRRRNG
ncbi:hypothetical protein ACXYN8_06935 [Altererythrobacter sp. CAU 1778]